jgi:hypothetical protein
VIEAARHGDPEPVITVPAKLAVIANAVAPDVVAFGMALAHAMVLPGVEPSSGTDAHRGWRSQSNWAPSFLTRTTERAAGDNNQ